MRIIDDVSALQVLVSIAVAWNVSYVRTGRLWSYFCRTTGDVADKLPRDLQDHDSSRAHLFCLLLRDSICSQLVGNVL